jgi:pyruvate, water dikinase
MGVKVESVDYVKWFSELNKESVDVAGGKGASLAEMYNAEIPVPPGFVVSAQAYSAFISESGIGEKIKKILEESKVDDTAALNEASKKIREIIENAELPEEMKTEIVEAYDVLDVKQAEKNGDALLVMEKGEESFVAVRSSATTEDLADASFAGQQETFLNIRGKKELLEKVKKCMSSLFTPRAIFYREKKGFKHEQAYLAVVVQKMIDSEKSGVMFSQNPTKADKSIVIEAVWGLGEGIVSGKIKPDHYVVDSNLEDFKIVESSIPIKKIAIIKNEKGKTDTIKLGDELSKKKVLSNYEIKRLAQFAQQLEEHYKKPQDIEFAIDKTGIFIVQSRPITTTFKKSEGKVEGNVLLSGLGASPGVSSGPVKIVNNLEDLEKIQEGDILVTEMTDPDMVVSMQKSAGIVTDEGGVTSHAAIVSREMGIPAVVGTGNATTKLKDGDVVTVDGSNGEVIEGKGETKLVKVEPIVPTKTEIKVIVDLPAAASRAAKSDVKGVGLMRLEGVIAAGGKHPFKFVQEKDMSGYVNLISEGIKGIANYFEEVWVRTSDLRSDEYGKLEGAPRDDEPNPMLGDHGIRFSLKHKEIMKSELEAVKRVAEELKEKKFGIMVPQVISVDEVRKTKGLAKEVGFPKNVKIGIMVETPAAVQIINELIEEGIEFISFGTNDLTQYTLAVDRNNEDVQELFDETHPAVVNSLKYVIRKCKKAGIKTSICGQAGSKPEMAKILVESGIDSISVNADAAKKISEIVAEIEKENSLSGNGVSDYSTKEDNKEVSDGKMRLVSEGKEKAEESVEVKENVDVGGEGKGVEEKTNKIPVIPAVSEQNKKIEGIFADEDIEAVTLAALEGEGDYEPGMPNGDEEKENVPPLNEAISVRDGEMDEEDSDEKIEEELRNELEKESGVVSTEYSREEQTESFESAEDLLISSEDGLESDEEMNEEDERLGREW